MAVHDSAALLDWYRDAGVDECIERIPQPKGLWGRTQPAVETPRPVLVAQTDTPLPAAPKPQAAALTEARALADKASTIEELKEAVANFHGCSLKKTATNTVFADGNPASRIMLIGEAPGAEEDKKGIPFCGASGKLLDAMLSHISLTRAEGFYITNTIFWRPPGNRQPTTEEIEICRPFVEKHIALVDPRIIVLVGGTATKAMLHESRGITKLRGQVFDYMNPLLERSIPTHVIYHPSFLLRQPLAKRQAWADLIQLKKAL